MEFEKTVRIALTALVLVLAFIAVLLVRTDQTIAEYLRLYELLGAVSASIIAVFGLWKMKITTG